MSALVGAKELHIDLTGQKMSANGLKTDTVEPRNNGCLSYWRFSAISNRRIK